MKLKLLLERWKVEYPSERFIEPHDLAYDKGYNQCLEDFLSLEVPEQEGLDEEKLTKFLMTELRKIQKTNDNTVVIRARTMGKNFDFYSILSKSICAKFSSPRQPGIDREDRP